MRQQLRPNHCHHRSPTASVRDWLRQRADYFGGSPNTELVRCVRTAMEREVGKDRAAGTAAVE